MGEIDAQRPSSSYRLLRSRFSSERKGNSLTIEQWNRYSADDKLDWLLTNVQVREGDEYRFLDQIIEAQKPKPKNSKGGCPPGGWPKKDK